MCLSLDQTALKARPTLATIMVVKVQAHQEHIINILYNIEISICTYPAGNSRNTDLGM